MGKFRCTLTFDLDMPNEKDEDVVASLFASFVASNILSIRIPVFYIKDFDFIGCKAEKINEAHNG